MGFGLRLNRVFKINWQVRNLIKLSRWLYLNLPVLGIITSKLIDRTLLTLYGIDVASFSINVRRLEISHPVGVLLGGNGLVSTGRVVLMSGVKLGGKNPNDKDYLEKHKRQQVFVFGDNVVIGSNSTILGPINICDNVLIGAMSLVNKSISEPGVYAGVPAKKISSIITEDWINN